MPPPHVNTTREREREKKKRIKSTNTHYSIISHLCTLARLHVIFFLFFIEKTAKRNEDDERNEES
jgi:hypothetical protein